MSDQETPSKQINIIESSPSKGKWGFKRNVFSFGDFKGTKTQKIGSFVKKRMSIHVDEKVFASHSYNSLMNVVNVKRLGTDFRSVTEMSKFVIPMPLPKQLLIKNKFLGISDADNILTAGRYDRAHRPPFVAGVEGLGEVVLTGPASIISVGQFVTYGKFGAFADYVVIDEEIAVPVPTCDPAYLAITCSGLTASLALEKEGDLNDKTVLLVTGADSGVGLFAVQIGKLAECYVIGTCEDNSKIEFLKGMGCDSVINSEEEDLTEALARLCPKGIDVVLESVGNNVLDGVLNNISIFGRVIIVGQSKAYIRSEDHEGFITIDIEDCHKVSIPVVCLRKSASIRGFNLSHYADDVRQKLIDLIDMYRKGKIKVPVDTGYETEKGQFLGMETVADAVEYFNSKKNKGKVVVQLNNPD